MEQSQPENSPSTVAVSSSLSTAIDIVQSSRTQPSRTAPQDVGSSEGQLLLIRAPSRWPTDTPLERHA
jgi:hypothetical protein